VTQGAAGFPPGWYPDPTRRHDHRWYDGTSWTAHVGDGGRPSIDPLDGPPGPPGHSGHRPPVTSDPARLARAGLVVAVVALPLALVPYLGAAIAVGALAMTMTALRRSRRATGTGDPRAVAGTVVAALAVALAALMTWAAFALMSGRGPVGDAFQRYVVCLETREPAECEAELQQRLLERLAPAASGR